MINFLDILMLLVAIVLPMVLGYFFKIIRLFDDKEVIALRKFVVKVSVPFLIFRNLYRADIGSLGQVFPSVSAYFFLAVFFTVSGYVFSRYVSRNKRKRNAFAFSTFIGNYAFLGWGVVYSFYGEEALTRAVFFTMFFWPIFLLCGFWMIHRGKRQEGETNGGGLRQTVRSFLTVLLKNALVPIIVAVLGIGLNLVHFVVPVILWEFIENFAVITIPMILFTIGLNFRLRMPRTDVKVLAAASFYRLVYGFLLGLLTVVIIRFLFSADILTQKVVLIESVMPAAAMTVFFIEYDDIDAELHSGIIGFTTLVSLVTIPFWYVVVERLYS